MSRRNTKIARKATLSLMAAFLAGGIATGDDLSASRAWAGPEKARKAKLRLVRVVDLPDVPALHWRGGKYKDLGYLFGSGGAGTWVAYIGPGQYEPLTRRELEQMIRLIAEHNLSLKTPVDTDRIPPQAMGSAEASSAAGKDSLMDDGAGASQHGAMARDGGHSTAAGKSALVRDDLDRALLPPADATLITGSTTRAAEMSSANMPHLQAGSGMRTQKPAPGKGDGSIRQQMPETSSGYWSLLPLLGLLAAGGAGMMWMLRRRKKADQALRERMHHVMRENPVPAEAMAHMAKKDEAESKKSVSPKAAPSSRSTSKAKRKAGTGASPQARHAKLTPDEALRAMQAAAQGGLTPRSTA